jgi:2,3-bisphosphoglycerate-independent phosphoglycerate mutase
MGNSEVGHLNLGAGRIVHQDIARIDRAVADGSFAESLGLDGLVSRLRDRGGVLHVIGLVSDGGVHSHIRHLVALLDVLPGDVRVHLHCLTDGRDSSPTGGAGYLAEVAERCGRRGNCTIATVTGRYWAMDRDKRWERTRRAYDLIARGRAEAWEGAADFLPRSYAAGVTDEFIPPTGIGEAGKRGIRPEDAVIMLNFRADRMRQLVGALTVPTFSGFERDGEAPAEVVTMTEYEPTFPVSVAFAPQDVTMGLSEVVAKRGLRQLKTAETEKYAHVSYFFNGGEEAPFAGEDRELIPSPKVATYDLKPEMSAAEVTDALIREIRSDRHDYIVCNFANPDMVGHTGVLEAAIKACETVDTCVGRVMEAIDLARYAVIVIADHGNCELMIDPATGGPHTAHTTNPVPCILVDPDYRGALIEEGSLRDIAPTILDYMGVPRPSEMTGRDLRAEL